MTYFHGRPLANGTYRIKNILVDRCFESSTMDGQPTITVIKFCPVDPNNDRQKWVIAPGAASGTYTLRCVGSGQFLSFDGTNHHGNIGGQARYNITLSGSATLRAIPTATTLWEIETTGMSCRLLPNGRTQHCVDFNEGYTQPIGELNTKQDLRGQQRWILEPVDADAQRTWTGANDFQHKFFGLTVQRAKELGPYDIIVIGTGIGGGVLAGDLFDTNSKLGGGAKSILVIERGNLVFHSHCLNIAQPSGLAKDRGQQNDTFFAAFKNNYTFTDDTPKDIWGGPMYCLGGRSAVWGLFAPRIHDTTLSNHFPQAVHHALTSEYYEEAEKLMNLSLPATKSVHQHLLERLNMDADRAFSQSKLKANIQWQWGRVASERREERDLDFAGGAYSTIDKLLEIAMSKPSGMEEHENFKILLGAEVRRLDWSREEGVKGVKVRTAWGEEVDIGVRPSTGKVVLCAGSVASPAILLRSGFELKAPNRGGCRLTDHDILYTAKSFRYKNPDDRREVGSMKLQTYVETGDDDVLLANLSLDTSSFLPRGKSLNNDLPTFIMAFITKTSLESQCTIDLVNDEPVVKIVRAKDDRRLQDMRRMLALVEATKDTVKDVLQVEFVDQPGDSKGLKYLELGSVSHELGTIPMRQPPYKGSTLLSGHSVDENLKFRDCEGLYVCDLSVFPYSPEANPSLTLAALSLRLSRALLPRLTIGTPERDVLHVVNLTGKKIKVGISNRGGIRGRAPEDVILEPGDDTSWPREGGTSEAVFVFKTNPHEQEDEFSPVPELFIGVPGEVLPII